MRFALSGLSNHYTDLHVTQVQRVSAFSCTDDDTHLLQAKMLNMGHEMTDAKKDLAVLEKENETRLTQLHEATSGDTLRFEEKNNILIYTNSINSDTSLILTVLSQDNLAEQQRMLVEREVWLQAQLDSAKKDNSQLRQDYISAMKDLGGCKVR
eukprot:sb/3473309/